MPTPATWLNTSPDSLLALVAAPTPEETQHRAALALAAQAVACLHASRPALRVGELRLRPQPTLSLPAPPVLSALRVHRPLLEETALVLLAPQAALALQDPASRLADLSQVQALLHDCARDDFEAEVAPDYAQVLFARSKSLLSRHWAQVQVVAAGLLEHGALNGEEVATRIRCVNGVNNRALN